MKYEAVIGLEVHAELQTNSKMFCSCPVVDSTQAAPNTTVCPVCMGMPGVLPVVNQKAVEYGLRVALALECEIAHTSLFARKNYFYPDLPKGYQISQFEYPLAERGRLYIDTDNGEKEIRVRRVHLEEDTGKLTHVNKNGDSYTLVDLNRSGVALLEIVSEPDLHSAAEARAYAMNLRDLVRAVGVNSGDMEKGVIRFEANVSIRPVGSQELNNRVEIKNLNSFRAMERAIEYEFVRQAEIYDRGGQVKLETLGWNETNGVTVSQRSKEEAHDYRYFPEPDLPPLVVDPEWVSRVKSELPELPRARIRRLQRDYDLSPMDASQLGGNAALSDYFEQTVKAAGEEITARVVANWMLGEVFAWMNQSGKVLADLKVTPAMLAALIKEVQQNVINLSTGKTVLAEMLDTGKSAETIIQERGLQQVSDEGLITGMVATALRANPHELDAYLAGKENLLNFFFGQVMRSAGGKANPQMVRAELERQLKALKGN